MEDTFETTDSEATAQKVSLIRSLWRGDTPLWKTYWLFAVLGGWILGLPFLYIENNSLDFYAIPGADLFTGIFAACVLAYTIFALFAVWRSAGKYKGPKSNAVLARISAASGILVMFGAIGLSFNPSISESLLQEEARILNSQLPRIIDGGVRIDRVSTNGLSFTSHYTFVDALAADYPPERFRSDVLPDLLINTCVGDLRQWVESGVQMVYEYRGSDGALIDEIQIERKNCAGIWGLAVGSSTELQTTDIAALTGSAFATIVANPGEPTQAFGSGFVVRSDGVIVTNLHIVEGAENVEVQLPNGQVFDDVDVLGADELRDILVLKIPTTGLSALVLGDDALVEIGEDIYVLGNPRGDVLGFGYDQTFSDGLISSRRSIGSVEYLQISAPISKGSSGGPVVNARGEAIAIATLTIADAQNLNLAVPIRYIYGILADALEEVPLLEFIDTTDFSLVSNDVDDVDDVDDRRALSAALARDASPEFMESISNMEEWEQAVYLRLLASEVLFADLDWVPYGGVLGLDLVAHDEPVRSSIFLEAGEYLAIGFCDDDCVDLDLYAYDENGTLLDSDEEIDAEPLVNVTVSTPGEYFFEANMYECETTTCLYAVQVYTVN
jgi:S1-C subfamily serine protease